MTDLYSRACWPVHAVDGDTLDVFEDNGRREYCVRRERLLGINTAELHASDPVVREQAVLAKEFVSAWFNEHVQHNAEVLSWPDVGALFGGYHEVAYFIVSSAKSDSFDRWLSKITCQAGHELNGDLLAAGLAVPFR